LAFGQRDGQGQASGFGGNIFRLRLKNISAKILDHLAAQKPKNA
jgi:hypothetical protein